MKYNTIDFISYTLYLIPKKLNQRFDILCNNCGQQVVFRPLQEMATCSSCGTHLKLEETERTISAVVIEKKEFLKIQQQPIPINQNPHYDQEQEFIEYAQRLKQLEKDWKEEQERFKVKNNKKMILPRKTQSLLFTIAGACLLICGIFFWRGSTFLLIIGGIWLFSSGKEYYKSIQYEQAKQDYEDEKERLQMAIDLLH